MRLHIANCTKQFYDFSYRVIEEGSGLRTQRVPIGGQITVAGDLSSPQIDSIIKISARYGMISADAVKNTRGFVNLVYSVDRPVSLTTIMQAMELNRRVLVVRGQETRKQAAVSANNLIETHLEEANNIATLDNFEVTIEEEERKNATGEEGDMINEGIRVSRSEVPDAPRPERAARTRSGRRKAA